VQRFVGGIGLAALSGFLTACDRTTNTNPDEQTPPDGVATPAAAPEPPDHSPDAVAALEERLAAFMALSAALVGGGQLDPDRGSQFLAQVTADPVQLALLDRLLSEVTRLGDSSPAAIASPSADRLIQEILIFWYVGSYQGEAVENRATAWFSLSAWQAVGYTAAPSVCKAFGLWASAPAA
jgi:hypothetical protein